MTQEQIEELWEDPEYHLMRAALGEYDDFKDYMGPEGDWKNSLIPRTLWGIDCNIASYKHDFRYFKGGNERDRQMADLMFLFDIIKYIEAHKCSWPWGTQWLHTKLARLRADKYYEAVKRFGKGSFNYHG